jgi:hypothetical protein
MTTTEATVHRTESEWEASSPEEMAADFAEYEQEAAERKARGAVVKPPKGKSIWRILPKRKGEKLTRRTWTHNINQKTILFEAIKLLSELPDGPRLEAARQLGVMDIAPPVGYDGFAATICASKAKDGPCFYCALSSVLRGIGNAVPALAETTKRLSKEIGSREEFFVGAVCLSDKAEKERGPRILQLTQGLYEKLHRLYADKDAGGDFSDPDKGFNIIIDRIEDPGTQIQINGKTMAKTTYEMSAARTSSKIENRDWLKALHNLETAREALDPQSVRALIEGGPKPAKLAPEPERRQIAATTVATPAEREPGSDDGDDDGDPDEILANPKDANDFDTRANFAKKGIRGIPL